MFSPPLPAVAVIVLRRLVFLGAALFFSGAGCSNTTPHATAPLVDAEPEAVGRGTFAVALEGVSDEKVCAELPPFADFCVTGLKGALHSGTHAVLAQFIKKDPSGPGYRASLRVLDLSQFASVHGTGDFDRPKVSLRWSFELRDDSGSRLLRVAETSDRTLTDPRAGDDAIQALLEDVLETIADELDTVDWQGSERRWARRSREGSGRAAPARETAAPVAPTRPVPVPAVSPAPEQPETSVPAPSAEQEESVAPAESPPESELGAPGTSGDTAPSPSER